MKKIHQETDDMRIQRLTHTVEADLYPKPSVIINTNDTQVKSFDCSKCGVLFINSEELMVHKEKNHLTKVDTLRRVEVTEAKDTVQNVD